MQRAQGIGPALRHEAMEGVAHLRPEQRVVDPTLRLIYIQLGRDDVVVAGQDHLGAGLQQLPGMRGQPLEPAASAVSGILRFVRDRRSARVPDQAQRGERVDAGDRQVP